MAHTAIISALAAVLLACMHMVTGDTETQSAAWDREARTSGQSCSREDGSCETPMKADLDFLLPHADDNQAWEGGSLSVLLRLRGDAAVLRSGFEGLAIQVALSLCPTPANLCLCLI